MNPFSTAKSYPHTTKIVDDKSPNAGNQTSITSVIPGSPLVFNVRDFYFTIYNWDRVQFGH